MTKKCSVFNCHGNYTNKTKRIVYGFPANPKEAFKWLNALPKALKRATKHMGVCEDHWPKGGTFPKNNRFGSPSEPPSVFILPKDFSKVSKQPDPSVLVCCIPSCRVDNSSTTDKSARVYPFPEENEELSEWLNAMPDGIQELNFKMGLCSRHWTDDCQLNNDDVRPLQPPFLFDPNEEIESPELTCVSSELVQPKREPVIEEEDDPVLKEVPAIEEESDVEEIHIIEDDSPDSIPGPCPVNDSNSSSSVPARHAAESTESNRVLLMSQLERLRFVLSSCNETNLENNLSELDQFVSISVRKSEAINSESDKHDRLVECYRKLVDLERRLVNLQRVCSI